MRPGIVRLTRIIYNEDNEICYDPIYINTHFISSFKRNTSGDGTLVRVANCGGYEVKETPEEILDLITYSGKCLNEDIIGFTADNSQVSVVSTEEIKKLF